MWHETIKKHKNSRRHRGQPDQSRKPWCWDWGRRCLQINKNDKQVWAGGAGLRNRGCGKVLKVMKHWKHLNAWEKYQKVTSQRNKQRELKVLPNKTTKRYRPTECLTLEHVIHTLFVKYSWGDPQTPFLCGRKAETTKIVCKFSPGWPQS